MFDDLLKSVRNKFGLEDKTQELVKLIIEQFHIEGVANIGDRLKGLGLDAFNEGTTALSADQTQHVLGPEFVTSASEKLGVDQATITQATGDLVPGIFGHIAPGFGNEGQIPDLDDIKGAMNGILTGLGAERLTDYASDAFDSASNVTSQVREEVVDVFTGRKGPSSGLLTKGLGVFILILIGGAAYWSCNQPKAVVSPLPTNPPSASTTKTPLESLLSQDTFSPEDLVLAINQETISFEDGKATVAESSTNLLEHIAQGILKTPGTVQYEIGVFYGGFSDVNQNISMSLQRAKSVVKKLEELGCPTDRLYAKGLGPTKNGTLQAKSQQVVFQVVR